MVVQSHSLAYLSDVSLQFDIGDLFVGRVRHVRTVGSGERGRYGDERDKDDSGGRHSGVDDTHALLTMDVSFGGLSGTVKAQIWLRLLTLSGSRHPNSLPSTKGYVRIDRVALAV